jgi:gamma-glutamylcyclotransferase (GGCT)/AIG2-like uncharacterized protein YtfP
MKLFVYGTLKVGGRYAAKFDQYRISSVPATINGRMYSVGGSYPAVVEGDDFILGEMHEYPEEVLPMMDYIEGFRGEGDERNLYNRTTTIAITEDGNVESVFVYFFNHPVEGLKPVKDGVWKI